MGHEQIADITWASQQVNIKQTYKVIFGIKVPSCLNLSQIIQATEIEGVIKTSLPSTQCRSELFKSGGANIVTLLLHVLLSISVLPIPEGLWSP